jgi:hypothetical protein
MILHELVFSSELSVFTNPTALKEDLYIHHIPCEIALAPKHEEE